jgi:predicted nucleotidyltransferase
VVTGQVAGRFITVVYTRRGERRSCGIMTPMSAAADDPILKRFRAALDEMYGERLERVVLFGSRARGDAHADSDYDVAVFLRDMADRWQEFDRLADLSTDILDKTGEFIHAIPYRAGSYEDRTSLMREIRYEGVDL